MKRIISILFCLTLLSVLVACSINSTISNGGSKDLLITEKTTQYFLDEKIPNEDINAIVNAGINATSAMNKQGWHFSVVTNKELLNKMKEKMQENMPLEMKNQPNAKAQLGDSPLAIIVSCVEKGEYDAGLASQNMFNYAILSGYGAKIVSSPTRVINENFKSKLNIPNDMNAVAVVLIGKAKDMTGVDGVTQATTRKAVDEIAAFIK